MRQRLQSPIWRASRRSSTALCLTSWLLCLPLLLWLLPLAATAATETKPTQYDVEAAYLFNFARFVAWPAGTSSSAPFLICVLGDDPFGPVLDQAIANETVGGRPVQDKRLTRPQDAIGCSILYISSSESSRLSKIFSAIQGAPVLTVSDIPDFVQQGGMIQFVLREGRVRFEVNLPATQGNGLSLSSELLKVAVQVVRAGGNH